MKIKLGISSCLLGNPVRYDGGHKLDHYLKETLGKFVEWIPVCPEVECGLPVPREAMRLIYLNNEIRLVTVKTNIDYTDKMQKWSETKLVDLEKEEISGFVFKSRSPSSGLYSAKIYDKDGKLLKTGSGLFANLFKERFPYIPVEEDGRLQNPVIRENFIEKVFIYNMWKDLIKAKSSYNKLIEFHTKIKLTILSHSQKHYKLLGKLVADRKKDKNIYEKYFVLLMEALSYRSTTKKHTNVLYHIAGYLKKFLDKEEKKELIEIIENYHKEYVPLIVPVTLLNHYIKKYKIDYLEKQYYLNPHPVGLMLRNHV